MRCCNSYHRPTLGIARFSFFFSFHFLRSLSHYSPHSLILIYYLYKLCMSARIAGWVSECKVTIHAMKCLDSSARNEIHVDWDDYWETKRWLIPQKSVCVLRLAQAFTQAFVYYNSLLCVVYSIDLNTYWLWLANESLSKQKAVI